MSDAKLIRGQVRQITKEILPDLIATELFAKLQEENIKQLNEIAKMVTERLDQIEQRSKDVQSYIMREMANSSNKGDKA